MTAEWKLVPMAYAPRCGRPFVAEVVDGTLSAVTYRESENDGFYWYDHCDEAYCRDEDFRGWFHPDSSSILAAKALIEDLRSQRNEANRKLEQAVAPDLRGNDKVS